MEEIFAKLSRYFGSAWRLAVLDMKQGRWIVDPAPSKIAYLRAENARGRHILIQPADASRYLLADDLSWELIGRQHHLHGIWKPGRMVVETSPHSYQMWIRSQRRLSLAEKRYWLKRMGSDPGADPNNRWGRCPGFRNRKDKHRDEYGKYPLAKLVWIDWSRQAQIPLTILPESSTEEHFSHPPPRGGVCLKEQIRRSDYDRGNESATDFSYALALARRRHSEDDIRASILSERTTWDNHRSGRQRDLYLDRTIRKAKAIIEGNEYRSM